MLQKYRGAALARGAYFGNDNQDQAVSGKIDDGQSRALPHDRPRTLD